jgi:hypothetical protein
MAKGIRSKCKRADRTFARKTRVEPALARRTTTLARVVQRSVVEKKDASGLMALVSKPWQQGFKSGFKKPVYDMGDDANVEAEAPDVVPQPIAGGTRHYEAGAFTTKAPAITKKPSGRRASTRTDLVWFGDAKDAPTDTAAPVKKVPKKKTKASR